MSLQLTSEQTELAKSLINSAERIVVTSHKNPDGDAAGSAFAMTLMLRSLSKNVTTILPDALPEFLQWLPGYDQLVQFDIMTKQASDHIQNADLIFVLDYNVLSRVGNDMQSELEKAKAKFILVDHHQSPGDFAVVTYSDTKACSTAQMVYNFIVSCYGKKQIDLAIAENIYCGIMTDTGSFRFPSVTQETHQIVGELIAMGMDHANVHRQVYDTNLLDRLKLIGYALSEKLVVLEECHTAFISLDAEELRRHNHKQGDTESLVNQALSIRGVKLAAFFREGNSEVKISFRSKGSFDVNQFARTHWTGGGHTNAAGATTQLSLLDAIEKFKKLVSENCAHISNS